MTDMHQGIREKLVQMERTTPELQQRYAQEVQAMYEKQLTGFRRWTWLIAAIMGIGLAVGFGTLSVVLPPDFPLLARLTFAAGALFGVGWAILGLRVFRRGSISPKSDNTAAAMMGAALPLLVAIVLMVSAPETMGGLRMMITGVFWLVFAAIFMLRHAIDRAAIETRERLLEIEYRVAELAERSPKTMTEQTGPR